MIETLLFYLRHRYLAATECLLFLCLYEMANEAGYGQVNATSLAERLGRSPGRCRSYLKRLERHGLLQTASGPNLHGLHYQLEMTVIGARTADRQTLRSKPEVSPAGDAPAPRRQIVGTRVLRRLK